MSSPERGTRGSYEEPYYSQYGTRGSSVAPIIDEELRYAKDLFSALMYFIFLFSLAYF